MKVIVNDVISQIVEKAHIDGQMFGASETNGAKHE